MKLSNYRVLTFDCYGTLIDWEQGILTALTPLAEQLRRDLSGEDLLQCFARLESAEQQRSPGALYEQILTTVYRQMAVHYGITANEADARRFGASVKFWPAFPDTSPALRYLQRYYKLVILSNVDQASFTASQEILDIKFDSVFTAEEIGSYKPDPHNFHFMIRRLQEEGFAKEQILHTAQSIFHDHLPASSVGLDTAWIDRRRGTPGWGATAVPVEVPEVNFHFGSLQELVMAHRKELGYLTENKQAT